MKDPAHAANLILEEVLTPFFPGALPPFLGREIYMTIRRRLQASRRADRDHADEVFQRTVVNAYLYLERNGGRNVRHTRGWLHRISVNATSRYLAELSGTEPLPSSPFNSLIEGEIQLGDNADAVDLELVREAFGELRPRHQELIRLELVEGLPGEEIQRRMGISSNGYYRKLKCEALKALRASISRLSTN
jgi:DNA-directed RNA polymerase specialized sigma24 family protein